MRIYISELSEEPKDLAFSEKENWVLEAVQAADESDDSHKKPTPSSTTLFTLSKTQDIVFIKGSIKTELTLLCSRCANPFLYPVNFKFQTMLTRSESLVDHNTHGSSGTAYSEPTGATEEDLEIEYLEKDYLELQDILKEQLYLKIPFQPLCKEDCKGICPVCGQDQNLNPCQCYRVQNSALARALKGMEVKIKESMAPKKRK